MANVNFNAVFSAFVNWYFNVNNANQINANFLRECGFDEMQFGENYIGAKGIKNADQFAKVIKSHYNETANIEILPDKMTEFAKVTFSDGVTFTVETCGIDELLNNVATDSRVICNYRGFDVKTAQVFDRVLYAVAIFNKYPDYNVFFHTFDDIKKYIDNNPNGL